MHKTESVLADGRPLVFFDDVDRRRTPLPDKRALEPRPDQAAVRRDPLTGEHVAIATHRQTRTFLPATVDCPLCPGREIPDLSYDVAVFENRWPAFSGQSHGQPGVAAGRCEVVAYSSDHDARFADLPPARIRTVVDAWADRSEALGALEDVAYVACFENRGEAIGVTLHHPHGQIYGYPFVPPVIARILDRAALQPSLFEHVLASELQGPRVLLADDHWLAYVPEAAQWPYEFIVMPRRHVGDLALITAAQRESLAQMLPPLFQSLDRLFEAPAPYIAGWRQSPTGSSAVRVHLRVMSAQRAVGKLKYLAGSESAYGVFANDVSPEDAAEALRRGIP